MQNVLNNLPPLHREVMENYFIPLNPDINIPCLLNVFNAKLAQLVTFKRVRVKQMESEHPAIVNYYGINIMSSGSGKDKVIREIDNYLFRNFRLYFDDKNKQYMEKKLEELKQEACQICI